MGYFSNGTEGEMYMEAYCYKCIHWTDQPEPYCPVWELHQRHNYEECNKPESMLHVLIPRMKAPYFGNGRCKMFIPAPSMGLPLPMETKP